MEIGTETAGIRHVRETWTFFSKYADHKIAKYAVIAYSHKSDMVCFFLGGGMDSTAIISTF